MKLLRRIGFYLAGFSVGLVLMAIFFKEKDTEFCYLPNCRVLKELRSKPLQVSDDVLRFFDGDDSIAKSEITKILTNGDVDFFDSTPNQEPCREYMIYVERYRLVVQTCDSLTLARKIEPTKD